jgi:uncharacterized protein YlxW (UPF0749 family)
MSEKTMFEQFYNATDEFKAAVKKPFVRRKLKLRFQSVLASIQEQQSDLQTEINEIYQKVEDLDINRLIEIEDHLEMLADDKEKLAKLYKSWFGTDLKDIDEE